MNNSKLSPCYPIKTAIQDFLENGTPMVFYFLYFVSGEKTKYLVNNDYF